MKTAIKTSKTETKNKKPISKKNVKRERISILRKKPNITEDMIRLKAYEFYLKRGADTGSELDDWNRAENELRQSLIIRYGF